MNINPDQYDELAEYGFGAIAVLALAALIYTELVPAPEAWTLLAGVIVAVSGAKAGEHRGRKKTNAAGKQELTDAFESVVESLVGQQLGPDERAIADRVADMVGGFEFGDTPSESTERASQTGTPAAHSSAADAKPAKPKAEPASASATETLPEGSPPDETRSTAQSAKVSESASGPLLTTITGIGPTYEDMLVGERVHNVAELATADTAALAESTGIPESRLQKWQEQARAMADD